MDLSEKYKISVVIPAYNTGKYLRKAVESVRSQTFKAYEVIIVDDGSTDNTLEIAKSLEDVKVIAHDKNICLSAARNTGIKSAKGDWVAFLDSDDYWKSDHLAEVVNILEKKPNLKWVTGCHDEILLDGTVIVPNKPKYPLWSETNPVLPNVFRMYEWEMFISTNCMVIKKDIFEEIGYFDEYFISGQDRDMWFRISHRYPEVGFIWPATAVYFKRSNSNSFVYSHKLIKNSYDLFEKNWSIVQNDKEKTGRFRPMGLWLAKTTIYHCLLSNNNEKPKKFLKFSIQQVGLKTYCVAWLITYMPFFMFLWNYYFKVGLKTKKILRKINLIK